MAEPEQSSSGVALVVEAIGSQSFEKKGPSIAEDRLNEKEKRLKDKEELLEQINLKYAMSKKELNAGSPDATDEEKAKHRRRILNAKTTRWRNIFSQWPRDPKGKCITPENSVLGKMAPNKAQLWRATLFDFYSVRRIPELRNLVTFSSGSKLAAWMKANGEDYAKNQLEFAENEDDPHLILPYEITELIQDTDRKEQYIGDKKSWIKDEQDKDVTKNKEREYWQVPLPWPPASPFDPLAYPKPWPDEPFTRQHPKLEKYIMQSHLPTVLNVHDPWNLLCAKGWKEEKKEGEAEAYQAFPRHFFEHWSGFNLIKPLQVPTPVGPLVPQFYGYYVPDIDPAESDSESESPGRYLSPILLLEDCGQEIDPNSLTLDDQSEVAALVFRFLDAGWIHGSIAKRNILIQPGPLIDMPLARYVNSKARDGYGVDWGFRLIDFGRAFEINASDRAEHEITNLMRREEFNIHKWISLDLCFNLN